jgi:hypothetical protein
MVAFRCILLLISYEEIFSSKKKKVEKDRDKKID